TFSLRTHAAQAVCVCVCVCCLCLFRHGVSSKPEEGSRVLGGWLAPAGRSADQSPSCPVDTGGGEDGHSCPGVVSHQEDAAGRPDSERAAHSHLHAAGRRCWRSFVLGIVVRSHGVLLCLKCVPHVSNRKRCSEVERVILEVN
uniref:Secreted protein n=1 Tax=Sparus aurata TaxID=8175 RepID=A0A671TTN2_SPAAU